MIHDHAQLAAASAYRPDVGDIVCRFQPMVRKLAWHFAGSGGPALDVDDLMQIGLLTLTECARRHQGQGEDGFAAYAKLRVRGAMIDALRRASFIPRGIRSRITLVDCARSRLMGKTGQEPTDHEIASEVKLSVEDVRQLRAAQDHVFLSFDDATETIEPSSNGAAESLEDVLAANQTREMLIDAVGALPERQALVIQLYFLEELNLAEIAEVLNVSVPRVHQIKQAALDRIRGAIGPE